MKANSARAASDRHLALIAALALSGAMVLGGGGSPSPLTELALQLLVAALAMAWLVLAPAGAGRPGAAAVAVCALLLVVPAVQLLPLPPALWHALPGRQGERAALALIGAEGTWRPLSVAPARTLSALLALVPPALILAMAASLRRSGRTMLVGTIAGVGLVSLLVGFAQMPPGDDNPFRFYAPDVGYLNGFQANHNSAADVLLIAMIAGAAVTREWFARHRPRAAGLAPLLVTGALVLVLSLGVFLTGSRAGTFLLPLAWGWVGVIVWPWWRGAGRALNGRMAAAALAGVIGVAVLLRGQIGERILARYTFAGEFRPQLWIDALFAARTYFPWGAGLGTFVPVFLAVERLEVVDATMPNRAHNDFLEMAIEAGLPGYVVLALIIAILGRFALAGLRGRSDIPSVHACFALGTFSVIAMHSLVDYPLRSMSLACMAAAAAGVLLPPRRQQVPNLGGSEGRI